MSLLELPLELFRFCIELLVEQVGVYGLVRQRLVSRIVQSP